jgi:two-component sensor histidine kinase
VTRHLEDAARRIFAVSRAHERIHQGDGTDRLDLGIYLEQVCRDLDDSLATCDVEVDAEHGIEIMTDRAILIALIVNELITKAEKHAQAGGATGTIHVRLARRREDTIELAVEDRGVGLPPDFDLRTATGLGMRIVKALSQQLGADIAVRRLDPGTGFVLTLSPLSQTHGHSSQAGTLPAPGQ